MKASKTDIHELVIKPLVTGYRPLKAPTDPIAYGEYVDQMVQVIHEMGFSREHLQDGMMMLEVRWRYQRWPVVGELIEFFEEAKPHKPSTLTALPTQRPEREVWAEKVMTFPEGQDALREGYARELYAWAEKNPGQTPGKDVVMFCREQELEFRARFKQLQEDAKAQLGASKDNVGVLYTAAALKTGALMVQRENHLRKTHYARKATESPAEAPSPSGGSF